MVENGKKYLVVDGCGGGWEFDFKSSDEEKMNNDCLLYTSPSPRD